SLLIAFGARLGGDIAFYVFTLFLLFYVPTKLGMPRNVALGAVLWGAVAQIIFIRIAGLCADRFGRRPALIIDGWAGAAGRVAVLRRSSRRAWRPPTTRRRRSPFIWQSSAPSSSCPLGRRARPRISTWMTWLAGEGAFPFPHR